MDRLLGAARPRRLVPSRTAITTAVGFLLAVVAAGPLIAQAEAKDDPWRLQKAIGDPEWVKISGELRLRYEGISGQFRSASRLDDVDHLGMQRTQLRFDFDLNPVQIYVELMDSRHYGGSTGSALNTTHSNAVDILQAWVGVDLGEWGSGEHALKVGRYTMDIGSRRLVARNRFRNTINSFVGVEWLWKGEESTVRAFWNMPTRREPSDLASLVDNDIEFDEQDLNTQFFGGAFEWDMDERHRLEVYGLGLLEEKGRQRNLGTIGARYLRHKKKGEFDFELEGIFQFGESRLSASGADLDHLAGYFHGSIAYTFDCDWSPRLRFAFDYATGDGDSGDGDNNRFETLFGARRWEYGPTGIYGAIARSNLLSPELRLELKPAKNVDWMIAARAVWLASDEDAWTTAGVADPTGNSGSFVGQQFETRVRWDIFPKNLKVDAGVAYLIAGEFQDDAPGGQGTDTFFGYVQMVLTF